MAVLGHLVKRAVPCAALLGLLVGCGTTPTTPTPPPPTPPPVVTAPVINSVTVAAPRVEVDTDLTITADVQDAEKPASALTYVWSATAGTFTGSGASVTWRLAKGAAATPLDVRITLTVVEPYQVLENGQLVNREHRVARESAPIRVHDSKAEIEKMVRTFLIDLFGNISISPDACLVDFSDSCPGKAAEREDIVGVRLNYSDILEVRLDAVTVTLHGSTRADVSAPCVTKSVHKTDGYEAWSAECDLTAVYEQQRWWLCSSEFNNEVRLPSAAEERVTRRKGSAEQPVPGTFPFYFR